MPNCKLEFLKWGDMATIAEQLGVSRQAVHQVYVGRSKSERISKALKQLNAKRKEELLKLAGA